MAGESVGGNMTATLAIMAKQRGDVTFVHTVEWHLRKVFAKLGSRSRKQLRAKLADPAIFAGRLATEVSVAETADAARTAPAAPRRACER